MAQLGCSSNAAVTEPKGGSEMNLVKGEWRNIEMRGEEEQ